MKEIIKRLLNHEELTSAETKQIMLNITQEMYPDAQIASLLTILQMRGVTVDELIGFREALMETRIPIDFSPYQPIDIVGTGGDGKNTFNISTCSCFVVAGAGYKVAKHGNYGASSVSGASNVLELHGVKFTNNQDKLRQSIEEC
ncbi:MAG: anthranilate phosphoribosyltransferase, partial [Bacteroidaceae bacterium]|nr:anthranilate phosphoribosyltransferase [Bacteroidaceae bacterium]